METVFDIVDILFYVFQILVLIVGPALAFGVIFRKAGYSAWLGLLMLVPLVNLVVLFWFAGATWPLEMGYAGQAGRSGVDASWELKMALRKALTLERRGEYQLAIKEFEKVIELAGTSPNAELARQRIRQIQERSGSL